MFRRSALPAAASLAVVLLAVTGSGPLIAEPAAGFSPVYSLVNGARRSIDVTMYEFSDTTAEHDLAAAAKRGVRVRVIPERQALVLDVGCGHDRQPGSLRQPVHGRSLRVRLGRPAWFADLHRRGMPAR